MSEKAHDGQNEKHLASHGVIDLLEHSKTFNPHEYYQNRKGLYVWDGFINNILSVAKEMEKVSARECTSHNLVKASNDAEIRDELPESHVWEDASEFCGHLAGMIDCQPKGKEGNLLSNGYANLFYVRGKNVEVFAVYVFWYDDVRDWSLNAYLLDADRWSADLCAFSCN